MKMKHLFSAGIAGTLVLITQAAFAQTWQTVDDYQYVSGQAAENQALTVAPNGTLFAAGGANNNDPDFTGHALIMASTDGGNTWSAPVDDFSYAPGDSSYYFAVASDPIGNLYAAGAIDDVPTLTRNWFVRGSGDGGVSWSTLDFVSGENGDAIANSVAVDTSGSVYVAGAVAGHWVVRKGIAGSGFATVDTVPSNWAIGAAAIRVHPTAGVFAAGVGPISTNTVKSGKTVSTVVYYGWVVRRSTDGGVTWATVDKFDLSSGYKAAASGIGTDAAGNLYVVGMATVPSGKGTRQTVSTYWVVRKSSNGGSSWSTVDSFQVATGMEGGATSMATDSSGNLYVAGYAPAADGVHWLVRENPGGNGAWQTVDDFKYLGGATATAITADASGHVFVGGYGWSSTDGVDHWLVRKH